MTKPPLDLVARFAKKMNHLNNRRYREFQSIDSSAVNAIPAISQIQVNFNRLVDGIDVQTIDQELYKHFEILNKDSATHRAISVLAGSSHDTLKSIPDTNRSGQVPLEKLTSGYLINALDLVHARTTVSEGEIAWFGHMLGGMVPSHADSAYGYHVFDYFLTNPHPFKTLINAQRYEFTLEDAATGEFTDYYAAVTFQIPQCIGNAQDMNRYEMRVQAALHIYQRGKPHWVLQAGFELRYSSVDANGLSFSWTSRPETSVVNFALRDVPQFNSKGHKTDYQADFPDDWLFKGPLDPNIDMYDEATNSIHYGVRNLIPHKALREGIRRWLSETDYYSHPAEIVAEWTNAQLAEQLLDLRDLFSPDPQVPTTLINVCGRESATFMNLTFRRLDADQEKDGALGTFILDYSDYERQPMNIFRWLTDLYIPSYSLGSCRNSENSGWKLRIKKLEDGTHRVVLPDNHYMTDRMLSHMVKLICYVVDMVNLAKSK